MLLPLAHVRTMKRLIVTADDFGLTGGVVEGISIAHDQGIVTSASLMVNAPAAEDAFRRAQETRSLSVGLHFVLTFGRPVGPLGPLTRVLKQDGTFERLESGAHASIRPDDVRAELQAQLDRFVSKVGRMPSHLDGHHHVHVLPAVFEVVLDFACQWNLPVRAPDDRSRDLLRAAAVVTTGQFLESFYGQGRIAPEHLIRILESLPEGTSELMCHPAVEDPDLAPLSRYSRERASELKTLTASEVRAAIETLGIELIATSAL